MHSPRRAVKSFTLANARLRAYAAVNFAMVESYWQIGQLIVEEEQNGKERADYGQYLIAELSKRLTTDFGKGFTETNLRYMRMFFLTFPIRHALRDELTWTHYRLLTKVENERARHFYLTEAIEARWSPRQLGAGGVIREERAGDISGRCQRLLYL